MKKVILGFFIATVIFGAFAFKTMYEPQKKTAEVTQMEGMFIFIKATPVMPYDVVGSEKTTVAWKGKPEEMVKIAIKKKSEHPQADGIIFTNDEMDRYDFIKFK